MKSTDKSMSCDDVLERVEAFVDSDLPPDEAVAVEAHIYRCQPCAEEVEFAREMQASLRSCHKMQCPDRVVEAVYQHIGLQEQPANTQISRPPLWETVRQWFSSPRMIPALGMAVVAVVAAVLLLKPNAVEHSDAEVAEATRQVEWTLAYLGSVNERVTAVATGTAVQPYVVEPVQRAVETALQTNSSIE